MREYDMRMPTPADPNEADLTRQGSLSSATWSKMENTHSSVTWFSSRESLTDNGTRGISDRYQRPISKLVKATDFVGPNAGVAGIRDVETSRRRKDSHAVVKSSGSTKKRGRKSQVRTSILIEEDFYTLFEDCIPTDERLKDLRQRWIDRSSLQRRLLYCQPFHIVFEEPEYSITSLWPRRPESKNLTTLVRRSHHELGELLQEERSEGFVNQLSKAWPDSFGSLISAEGGPRRFQWHKDIPRLDHGTTVVCRKSLAGNRQDLLTIDVSLRPSDNVIWQILPTVSNSIMSMRMVAFLETLFAPTHSNFTSFGIISDWFPVQSTTPALHSTGNFGQGDWLCVQLNMRACIPDQAGYRAKQFEDGWGISPKTIGFPLQRQAAKIPDLARGTAQFAVEFLLSVSIVLKKRHRVGAPSALNYNIVVWLDYNTKLEGRTERGSNFPVLSDRIDLDLGLEDCGAGAEGFFQLLIVLTRTIDHWRKCWDAMMDKIDEIISVQLQDTLDKNRWGKLMFDDSFQLSEQYFTVLQLLRIFQNWIGETEKGVQSLGDELVQQCELWQFWRQEHAEMDELEWRLDTEALRNNIRKVIDFLELRVTPLRERIEKKNEEVKSLQDALLNASSLREALKAKTLNLYIGVFTTVTVFFTTLGFMTV
ncbi:hypothetical protein O1611_g3678 [Lasiodiplodia mahajangana]|uniref:Uncharacterized protein n=1 Tax=Lasiodiplodia mahajangana TaxID=1108764 RepID=A0ACC2JRX0_9PEZI|nr:hypothetical protein O1611_g3678 [Lasiodiplodia mahajangana]